MSKHILKLHNRLWYDRHIPRPLQHQLGTRFRINLQTSDEKEAMAKKDRCDALFSLTIDKARRQGGGSPGNRKLAEVEAKAAALLASPRATFDPDTETMSVDVDEAMDVLSTIEDGLRGHFLDLTNNRTITRLSDQLEAWLATMAHIHPRTVLERRTVAQKLIDWSLKNGAVDARKLTRDHARAFVASLAGEASTVNKALQAPTALWKYLKEEGIDVDPAIWAGLGPKRTRAEKNTNRERPFTLTELQKLFSKGNISGLRADLRDAMTISLFSGMRLSEAGELKVEDIDLDKEIVTIKGTKSGNALRIIPLHHRLKALLSARSEGKGNKGYILHELNDDGLQHGRKRSAKLSQAFTRYREGLGIADDVEGKRRSLINFHSLRRTADKAMMEYHPSIQPQVIDQFFGWSAEGAMRSRYAVGADMMKAMREALKALVWKGVYPPTEGCD